MGEIATARRGSRSIREPAVQGVAAPIDLAVDRRFDRAGF
jgi:hypothetical protein